MNMQTPGFYCFSASNATNCPEGMVGLGELFLSVFKGPYDGSSIDQLLVNHVNKNNTKILEIYFRSSSVNNIWHKVNLTEV